MERRGWKKRVARRGGVLAHMVTFANVGCGFAAILLIFEKRPEQALSLVFLAGVLDFFDGALARLAGHSSPFGKELDSLADMVSFGIVPAFLAYRGQFGPPQPVIGLVCLAFVLAGAWRLALFNVLEPVKDFRGMPITVGGMILAALAYLGGVGDVWPWPVLAALTLGVALLMVSQIRFVKLSRILSSLLRKRRDAIWWVVLPVAVLSVVTIIAPLPQVVVVLGAIYTVSSLVVDRRGARRAPVPEEAAS